MDSVSTEDLAANLHSHLLPHTTASAESYGKLATRLQAVAAHLQQTASNLQRPTEPLDDAEAIAQGSAHDLQLPSTTMQSPAISTQKPLSRKQRKRLAAKPFLLEAYQQQYVALEVFYLGWSYHGFASQCGTEGTVEMTAILSSLAGFDDFVQHTCRQSNTQIDAIQGILFDAMRKAKLIAQEASWQQLKYSRCGRTDKGVSAAGQVIALLLRSAARAGQAALIEEDEMDYSLKINKELPPDIRVLAWCCVPPDFSARFSTAHREYMYYIIQHGQLDIAAMRKAASHLVGEHDFRNFCKLDLEHVKSFRRRILDFQINEVQPAGADGPALYVLHVKGTAFLWHQVRCMAAVLLMVGQQLEDPIIVQQLLDIKQVPCKPQYRYANEMPLLFSKCVYHGLKMRTCDKALSQTLKILEQEADKYRIGCSMYTHVVQKLKMLSDDVHHSAKEKELSHYVTHAPHVKMLKREKEPDIAERLRIWEQTKAESSLPVDEQMCVLAD